jgi:hypothetical protein
MMPIQTKKLRTGNFPSGSRHSINAPGHHSQRLTILQRARLPSSTALSQIFDGQSNGY